MSCFGACSILGAICESLCKCECGFFSIGKLCDCSKVTIVVPQGTNVNSVVEGTLKERVEQTHATTPPLMMNATVKQIKIAPDAQTDYVDQSIQAIELIAKCTLSRWMKKLDNFSENWARFETSYRLAKVDLDKHISDRKPLLAKESKRLNRKIEKVERYGSLAADLLAKVYACEGDWEKLKTVNVPPAVGKFLSQKKLISADFKDPILFSKIGFTIQRIFIKAVKKNYSSEYVREHGKEFIAWVEAEKNEKKTEQEEKKSSPFTGVHNRLNDHFSPSKIPRALEDSPLAQEHRLSQQDENIPLKTEQERHFTFIVPPPSRESAHSQESSHSNSSKERLRHSPVMGSVKAKSTSRENSHSTEGHASRPSSRSPQAREEVRRFSPSESREPEDVRSHSTPPRASSNRGTVIHRQPRGRGRKRGGRGAKHLDVNSHALPRR